MNTSNMPPLTISGDMIINMVLEDGSHSIGPEHPNHDKILEAIRAKEWDSLVGLADIPAAISSYMGTDSKIKINEFGEVIFNGEVLHNVITRRVKQFFDMGLPFQPLINFMENLMANPSRRAVEELYIFLENEGMAITEDGCFIGYKGVKTDFMDVHSGKFDNSPGQIIEMPRNAVDDDARKSCSYGFHVGSQKYATGWGPVVMLVKVNPADAVSVPYDNAQKLRVCKYEVLRVEKNVLQAPLFQDQSDESSDDDEEDEQCGDCYEHIEDCECNEECIWCHEINDECTCGRERLPSPFFPAR